MVETDIYVQRARVVAWMEHIRKTDRITRELEPRIQEVHSRLLGLGYDPSNESRGGSSDALLEGVSLLMELQEEWNHRISTYQREYEHVKDLCSPSNPNTYAVWLRYVEGRDWESVAHMIGFSRRNAYRVADNGVRELYPHVPEEIMQAALPKAGVRWH